MKAIVQDTYGSAEVLQLREIEQPEVGDEEVLVRVHAAGVDAGVWHLMTGLPYLIRIIGFGFSAPKIKVRGTDVAGRVEAVGKNVERLKVGDEVFGSCDGSFAEYACGKAEGLALKPANMSFEQAAAVPASALTALQGLRDHAKLQAGQKILIIGAGGGVGTYAVQIAKAFGAEVVGVCSTGKVDLVRSIGADHVIDYTRQELDESGPRYDVIFDIAGNRALSRLRRLLTATGTLIIVGGEDGDRWIGGTHRQIGAMLLSPFVGQTLSTFVAEPRAADLEQLKEMLEESKITPVIDRTFPLRETADAIRYLADRSARGKVVITN